MLSLHSCCSDNVLRLQILTKSCLEPDVETSIVLSNAEHSPSKNCISNDRPLLVRMSQLSSAAGDPSSKAYKSGDEVPAAPLPSSASSLRASSRPRDTIRSKTLSTPTAITGDQPMKKRRTSATPISVSSDAHLSSMLHLPSNPVYHRSYMHRSVVTHVSVTPTAIIVASADGRVTFWNRDFRDSPSELPRDSREGHSVRKPTEASSRPITLTFIKSFQAHRGRLSVLHVTSGYDVCLTLSDLDSTLKLFNVHTYDMSQFAQLSFTPASSLCTIPNPDRVVIPFRDEPVLAVILLHDISAAPRHFSIPLKSQLSHIAYVPKFSALILCDTASVLSYAAAPPHHHYVETSDDDNDETEGKTLGSNPPSNDTLSLHVPHITFRSRLQTDLYTHAQSHTKIICIAVSPTGAAFSTTSLDCRVRIFDFLTGRLRRVFDETPPTLQSRPSSIPSGQFVRRLAREKQLQADRDALSQVNIVWDESGSFLLYATVLGIKMVHVATNHVSAILGLQESAVRFTCIDVAHTIATVVDDTSQSGAQLDSITPLVVASAFDSERIFLFGSGTSIQEESRDVCNEKPMARKFSSVSDAGKKIWAAGNGFNVLSWATLHTTVGDISIELFRSSAPRTVENFTTHARNGYFDGVPFHRVIKSFMIQTGDPDGDGTGGESIWGGEFDDEIDNTLRHEPGIVSMANAGPNTNGSQFFIVCGPSSHLDGKHTIFGMLWCQSWSL